ncbi:predicted protein [Histoplasma capsulatum G186AR]|uniref:Uncharacterized protein n=1 Tax=Ajellomyces capsulatus (strain G186AR / H82 / ATCC MYA-2454 / RMSCC 2432) TaxID=447093 RepID=C0NLB9_AJECG|nr:uncharacterized protein HCBG_04299 [Histoplasma capsulatum G186AR]EEH07420.1 predicted protein [Histoplasma capsulatum G186AR]
MAPSKASLVIRSVDDEPASILIATFQNMANSLGTSEDGNASELCIRLQFFVRTGLGRRVTLEVEFLPTKNLYDTGRILGFPVYQEWSNSPSEIADSRSPTPKAIPGRHRK